MRKRINYSTWEGVPEPMIRLAEERTRFLQHENIMSMKTVKALLANAYLQGMADCADVSAALLIKRDEPQLKSSTPEGLA